MENLSLESYILAKLKGGEQPDIIKRNLILAGWSESDVMDVLKSSLIANGVPSPTAVRMNGGGSKTSSTVEIVLNFFTIILLGIIASALATLYYQIINAFFPDPLSFGYGSSTGSRSAMHYAMAALLVGFPLYFFSLKMWFKRFHDEPEKVESQLSKWLTYIVLLIAAVTIVGDLITTIFYLLQGEVTARFFFKALTILVVAGIVFGFYFFERRVIQYRQVIDPKLFQGFALFTSILIALGIIIGFVVGGLPAAERLRGLDSQRSNDLLNLSSCISSYSRDHKRLPASLEEITGSSDYAYCVLNAKDAVTAVPYEYSIITASAENNAVMEGTFQLCANFDLATEDGATLPVDPYIKNSKWGTHSAGRYCNSETVILENDLGGIPIKGIAPAVPVR